MTLAKNVRLYNFVCQRTQATRNLIVIAAAIVCWSAIIQLGITLSMQQTVSRPPGPLRRLMSANSMRWSQVIVGSEKQYTTASVMNKPDARYGHTLVSMRMGLEGSQLVLFGGSTGIETGELWSVTAASAIRGKQFFSGSKPCHGPSSSNSTRCFIWKQHLKNFVSNRTCCTIQSSMTSRPGSSQRNVSSINTTALNTTSMNTTSTNATSSNTTFSNATSTTRNATTTAGVVCVDCPVHYQLVSTRYLLARQGHSMVVLTSASGQQAAVVFGGYSEDRGYIGDLWLLETHESVLRWTLLVEHSGRLFDPVAHNLFPRISTPSPRSGHSAHTVLGPTSSSRVAFQRVATSSVTARLSAAQLGALVSAVNLSVANKSVAWVVLAANHSIYPSFNISFPTNDTMLLVAPAKLVSGSSSVLPVPSAPLSVGTLATHTAIFSQTTLNTTSAVAKTSTTTHTLQIASSTTSGDTSMLLFGGWAASRPTNDLWVFDAERQVPWYEWNQPVNFTYLAFPYYGSFFPSFASNYNATLHPDFPSLPTYATWQRITPASGSIPAPRHQHASCISGVSGGMGSHRLSLLVHGGQGDTGVLADLWELSLETLYGFREAIELSCTADGGALSLSLFHPDTHQLLVVSIPALATPRSTAAAFASASVLVTVSFSNSSLPANRSTICSSLPRATPVIIRFLTSWLPHAAATNASNGQNVTVLNPTISASSLSLAGSATGVFTSLRSLTPLREVVVPKYTWTVHSARPTNLPRSVVAAVPLVYTAASTMNSTNSTNSTLTFNITASNNTAFNGSFPIRANNTNSTRISYNTDGPSARSGHTLTAMPGSGDRPHRIVLMGGWDGDAPTDDIWELHLGSAPGHVRWSKSRTAGTSLACRDFGPLTSLMGGRCAANQHATAPSRYKHAVAAVPVAGPSSPQALLAYGGVAATEVAAGENPNWLLGASVVPDLYAVCTADTDPYCATPILAS